MKEKYNVLVIDDDPSTLMIFNVLSEIMNEVKIFTAISLNDAEEIVSSNFISLVILDIVLPETDGYEIMKNLLNCPNAANAYYIFMSADKHQLLDRIKAYGLGVQDFILKPFDIKEVELLINSKIIFFKKIKELTQSEQQGQFKRSGDFIVDKNIRKVSIRRKEVSLTSFEFELMMYFISNPDKILGINDISFNIWGNKDKTTNDSARALIFKLRKKIENDPKNPVYIVNSESTGYIFFPLGKKN